MPSVLSFSHASTLYNSCGYPKLRTSLINGCKALRIAARPLPQSLLERIWSFITQDYWTPYEISLSSGGKSLVELNISSLSKRLGVTIQEIRDCKLMGAQAVSKLVKRHLLAWEKFRQEHLPPEADLNTIIEMSLNAKGSKYLSVCYEKPLKDRTIKVLSNGAAIVEYHKHMGANSHLKTVHKVAMKVQDKVTPLFLHKGVSIEGDILLQKASSIAEKIGKDRAIPPTLTIFENSHTSIAYPECTSFFDKEYIEYRKTTTMSETILELSGAAFGLKKMHELGYIHADVKLSNILLNLSEPLPSRSVLADFDGSCLNNTKHTPSFHYTDYMLPPEMISLEKSNGSVTNAHSLKTKLSPKADIWAFGVCILQSCLNLKSTPQLPWIKRGMKHKLNLPNKKALRLYATLQFSDRDLNSILKRILPKLGAHKRHWAEKIIRGCLEKEPQNRINSRILCEYLKEYESCPD